MDSTTEIGRLARVTFTIGCVLLLLTAALHLIGHFAPKPEPADDTHATLFQLAGEYRLPLPGGGPTLMELLQGYSLLFALLLAFIAIVSVTVLRARSPARLIRLVTWIDTATLAIMLGVSLAYFFIIPTICIAAALAFFVISLLAQLSIGSAQETAGPQAVRAAQPDRDLASS